MNIFVKGLLYALAAVASVLWVAALAFIGAGLAAASGIIIDLVAPDFLTPVFGRSVPMWRLGVLIGWTAVMAREAFGFHKTWERVSARVEKESKS